MAFPTNPSERNLRKPTDPAKENGPFVNTPTYAEMGGLNGPRKIAARNQFRLEGSRGKR